MVAWPAAVGAIAEGVSALGGLGGGKDPGRSSRRHEAWQMQGKLIQQRVADAKAAGVHPLYAMGANIGGGAGQFLTSGSSGKDAIRVARGVSAGMRSIQRGTTSPEDAARIQLMGTQQKYYEALTAKALSDIARMDSPGGRLELGIPGAQAYGPEELPVSGGIQPRRTYRSPMFGNLAFKKGSPTAQQREDEAGEIMGNLDSFVSYLNSVGRKLGMYMEGVTRKGERIRRRTRPYRSYRQLPDVILKRGY